MRCNMTFLEIEAFLEIVRCGSITAAADALFITQPALSRRLKVLEEELGYPLIRRGKGQRGARLTEEGKAFISIAEKWRKLWQETKGIADLGASRLLTIAAIGSMNTYLLPQVYRRFLADLPGVRLHVTDQHSNSAYDMVASGAVDIAFISDDRFVRDVETIPLFREKMVLVSGEGRAFPAGLQPFGLDPAYEIRLPWNPEYDLWHDYWFGTYAQPRVLLDQMAVLEDFMQDGRCWAILPASVAERITHGSGLSEYPLQNPPPDRIIYYLLGKQRKMDITGPLLGIAKEVFGAYGRIELL